ncbi:RHS repeat-associated core domain-containing protein [Acanthopleuribacter pedis]|uniref:RHS domain-containing protein n=1 Tax=Acanthopleuribacter pedis TaxID=442870 RepID=A0A8J7QQV9_9BACT|nr:RHS repeat-associated core domain-containing protein [Acanthopleuribacter pedis]MBO1322525.1 RHS domain-containing protein [Acanthopleuribacter pedis]
MSDFFQKRHPRPASAAMQNRPTNVLHTIADGINTVVGAPARVVDKVNEGFAVATNAIAEALPSFPAATFGNMALGMPHAHILHPPSGPLPIPPIPLPSLGPIMLGNCVQVLINGKPAARAGDIGLGPTCCGLPPFYEIFTGSSKVFIGGSRAARVTDVTMHCTCVPAGGAARAAKAAQQATKMAKFMKVAGAIFSGAQTAIMIGGFTAQGLSAVGDAIESVEADNSAMADALALSAAMGAAQLANDAAAMAASLLMGKDICIAPVNPGMILNGSPNVLIGGFPMPSWMDLAKGLLKLVKGLRSRMRRRQNNTPSAADNGRPARTVDSTPTNGCPISMINGEELLDLSDFDLRGPLPFKWRRIYRSSHNRNFGLGHGWTFPGVEHLRVEAEETVYFTEEGRNIFLPRLAEVGDEGGHSRERMNLVWESDTCMRLTTRGEPDKLFAPSKHRADYWDLSAVVDRYQNRITFERDSQGRLETITNGYGRGVRLVYGSAGMIEHIVPEGEAYEGIEPAFVSYEHDLDGDLVAVRNRAGNGERYRYENHVLLQRTMASGFNFFFEWDRHDIYARCLRNWGEDGLFDYHFIWSPEGNRSECVDSRGARVGYDFDEHGMVTCLKDRNGRTTYTFYNDLGDPTRVMGPGSIRETYEYDERGNCTRFTNAGDQVFEMTYDGEDCPITFTDPAGFSQKRTYNKQGSVSEILDPLGNATRFAYSAQGMPTRIDYGGKGSVALGWNATHDLLWKRDGAGRTVRYQTTRDGFVEAVTLSDGSKIKYELDGHGLPIGMTENSGRRHRFAYNALGRMTKYTDPTGRTMHQEFHPFGLLTRLKRLNGSELRFGYDSEANLTTIHNEKDETYRVHYDFEGNIIGERGFDGLETLYKRDERGFVKEEQIGGTQRLRYQRDNLGRVLQKTGSSRAGNSCSVNYTYDAAGHLVQARNEERTSNFTYDVLGNLLEEAGDWGFVRHAYDTLGRRTASQYGLDHLLEIERGEAGFVESMRWNGESLADFALDGLGRERRRKLANDLTIDFQLDEHQRWKNYRVTHNKKTNGDRLVVDRYFQYDDHDRLSQVHDSRTGLTVYKYDLNDRLDSVEGFLDEVFHYDPAGNLLATQGRKPEPEAAPDPSPGNRLVEVDGRALEYDAVGNVIARLHKGSRVDLEYNAFNQLIRSTREGKVTEYGYDALGRRVRKTTEGVSTWFTWDRDTMVQERTEDAALITYLYEPGRFAPLARTQGAETLYYHNDHRGAPREMTDTLGQVVWSAQYSAYGRIIEETGEGDNKLRLQGQYQDDESGLYYNAYRYYDPELGRYIGQDPIGLDGGLNAYVYTADPLRETDPLGLCRSHLNATSWQHFQQVTTGWFTNKNNYMGDVPANPTHHRTFAASGWQVYRNTSAPGVMPIMGRTPHLDVFEANNGLAGYDRLNANNWSLHVNDAWMMGGVDSGKTFRIVSDPFNPETHIRRDQTTQVVQGPSVTNRELGILSNFGYTFYPDGPDGGGYMVPPGGSPPSGVTSSGVPITFPMVPATGSGPP